MYYVTDEAYFRCLDAAEAFVPDDVGAFEAELKGCPLVRSWDCGEDIGVSSGEWAEVADLFDAGAGDYVLRVQEVYAGWEHENKEPRFFCVPREVLGG